MTIQLVLPRPVRSIGDRSRVGEIIECIYEGGYLTKEITRVDPLECLEFRVVDQELHFEHDVTLVGGRFLLGSSVDAPQKTKVTLTTDYKRHLRPEWLWKPIEVYVVHTLHSHVLEGMKRRALKTSPTAAVLAVSTNTRTERVD